MLTLIRSYSNAVNTLEQGISDVMMCGTSAIPAISFEHFKKLPPFGTAAATNNVPVSRIPLCMGIFLFFDVLNQSIGLLLNNIILNKRHNTSKLSLAQDNIIAIQNNLRAIADAQKRRQELRDQLSIAGIDLQTSTGTTIESLPQTAQEICDKYAVKNILSLSEYQKLQNDKLKEYNNPKNTLGKLNTIRFVSLIAGLVGWATLFLAQFSYDMDMIIPEVVSQVIHFVGANIAGAAATCGVASGFASTAISLGYLYKLATEHSTLCHEAANTQNITSTLYETSTELNKQKNELEKEEALLQQIISGDTVSFSLSDSTMAGQKVQNTPSSPETLVHQAQHNKCIQNNQVSY